MNSLILAWENKYLKRILVKSYLFFERQVSANCGGVGWTLYNGYAYCFVTNNNQYQPGAIQACQTLGAQLVSIHSVAENTFVNSM